MLMWIATLAPMFLIAPRVGLWTGNCQRDFKRSNWRRCMSLASRVLKHL